MRWAQSWSRCTGSKTAGDFLSYPRAVGFHYFPPGLQSPSQQKNVTVLRPVWYPFILLVTEAHRCKLLAQGYYAALSWWELNPRPIDCKSNALSLNHCTTYVAVWNPMQCKMLTLYPQFTGQQQLHRGRDCRVSCPIQHSIETLAKLKLQPSNSLKRPPTN